MSLLANTSACAPGAFSGLTPVFGTEILSVHAAVVSNFTMESDASMRFTSPSVVAKGVSFCNVTVSYTHSKSGDEVFVEAWLPPTNSWNERLYKAGGSGLGAGRFLVPYVGMAGAISEGYATVTSDAGVGGSIEAASGVPWILKSPGNVNLQLVQNFGTLSLKEEAVLAKQIVNTFYGKKPKYSYFNGCSQGGRQGLALAQTYPDEYDGIVVGAPGINLAKVIGGIHWPQQIMNDMGEYPHDCEMNAIVEVSVAACDGLDGVEDGIIAQPRECLKKFDPLSAVGTKFTCWPGGQTREISKAAAIVVNATWSGVELSPRQSYPGLFPGANITGSGMFDNGIARTNCTAEGVCTALYNLLSNSWLKYFGAKDPSYNLDKMSRTEFQHLIRLTGRETASAFQTDDSDLSPFQAAGGKLLSWHGTSDDAVSPDATARYFDKAKELVPGVDSFYKHYEIPGLGHCSGGAGGQPTGLFAQLRAWVENGTAPESSPVTYTGPDASVWNRIICPYPQKVAAKDGCKDLKDAGCWECAKA